MNYWNSNFLPLIRQSPVAGSSLTATKPLRIRGIRRLLRRLKLEMVNQHVLCHDDVLGLQNYLHPVSLATSGLPAQHCISISLQGALCEGMPFRYAAGFLASARHEWPKNPAVSCSDHLRALRRQRLQSEMALGKLKTKLEGRLRFYFDGLRECEVTQTAVINQGSVARDA